MVCALFIQAASMINRGICSGEGDMGDRFVSPGTMNRVHLRDDFKKGLRCFNCKDYEGALMFFRTADEQCGTG